MSERMDAAALRQLRAEVTTDPAAAIEHTTYWLQREQRATVRPKLLWIRGLAHRALHDVGRALTDLHQALDLARETRDRKLLAQVLITLSGTLAYHGEMDEALALLDEVPDDVGDRLAADHFVQRAFILQRANRIDDAERSFAAALDHMGRAPSKDRADLLSNRGIMRTYQGRFTDAETDLRSALHIYERCRSELQAAELLANLAWLDGRRGELVDSLRKFAAATERFDRIGVHEDQRYPDECETYLAAGLADEAHRRALRAATVLEGKEANADAAEMYLMAARAALAGDDAPGAAAAASAARRLIRGQGTVQQRPGWAAEAGLLAALAAARRSPPTTTSTPQLLNLAAQLDEAGMPSTATDALLLAARVAVDAGDLPAALHLLRRTAGRQPSLQQMLVTSALRARSALARGDRGAARRSISAGWRLLDDIRSGLAAPELRAYLALHGGELADLDMALALADQTARRPVNVLRTAERWRAAALRQPRLRPPADQELNALLAELRSVEEQLLHREGFPRPELAQRFRHLQLAVVRRSRIANCHDGTGVGQAASSSRRTAPLAAGWTILALIEHRGQLYSVVPAPRRTTLVALGSADTVRIEATFLKAALTRISRGTTPTSSQLEQVGIAAHRLEEMVLTQLPPDDRPVLLVLPASLADVPWACLPRLRPRAFTIVPSLAIWNRLAERPVTSTGRIAFIAGPDLAHADPEVSALATIHRYRPSTDGRPDVHSINSRSATAATVLQALDGTAVAHLACHGSINAANPLLSHLQLTDGPLYVQDLEQLGAPPTVTILSACHVGAAAARPGDELLGFTTSLLSLGSRSVIAATQAVLDSEPTVEFMAHLHLGLATGRSPAHALAAARTATGPDHSGSSFSCFGAG